MKFFYLIPLTLFLFSCHKSSEKKLFDVEVSQDFTVLFFDSSFEVYLTQGSSNAVTVECSKKSFSKLEFAEEDSTLKIKNEAKFSWTRPKKNDIILHITVKDLKKIMANETCHIKSTGTLKFDKLGVIFASKLNEADLEIDCKNFYYWNNFPCGGKLTLSGKAESMACWNYALMQIDASACLSKLVYIENSSKGDCSFNASEKIEYRIFGEGDINCFGNPTEVLAKESSGKGQFILK